MASTSETFHRLSGPHGLVWLKNPAGRRMLAKFVRAYYDKKRPGGVGEITICSINMFVIGYIDTFGNCRLQDRPWPQKHPSVAANMPDPRIPSEEGGCACWDYYHPLARSVDPQKSRWGKLGKREHHPHCEFRPDSLDNFNRAARNPEQDWNL